MANPASLRVRISADLADIKQGLGVLRGELAGLRKQADAALPSLTNNAAVQGLRRIRQEVTSLAAAYLSLRGVSILGAMADEATQIRGRIRAAGGDYQRLLQLANDTRTSLAGTTDLYARMERSTRSMGLGQEKLLELTRTVNQAIRLSFASQGAADAAITQFGQALASGQLRGEELNSVLEQTPRLAEAVAAGLGVGVGQLRAMAKEGKLTNEQVLKALATQAEVVAREFEAMPRTMAEAWTVLRNNLVDYVGKVDQAHGISQKLVSALTTLAQNLPRYLDPLVAILGQIIRYLDVLVVLIGTRLALAGAAAIPALIARFVALRASIIATVTAATTLRGALAMIGGPIGLAIAALAAGIYLLYQRTNEAKRAAEEHTKALEANKNMALQSKEAALEDAKAKRQQAIDTLKAASAALQEAKYKAQAIGTDIGGGGPMGMPRARMGNADPEVSRAQKMQDQALQQLAEWQRQIAELERGIEQSTENAATGVETAGERITGSNALLRDSIERQLRDLDRMYAAHEIGIAGYYQARRQLQQQAIDAEIEQARMQLAAADKGEARRRIEETIVKLQRDRAEIATASAREEKKAIEELDKVAGDMYVARLEREGQLARAVRARLEEEFKERIVTLQANGREEDVRTIRLHIDAEVAKSQLGEFDSKMTQVLANLQAKEQSVAAQQEAGLLGIIEGERQVKEARAGAMQQLLELRQAAVDFMGTLAADSPEAQKVLAFLNQLDGNIGTVASSMQRFRQQLADAAIESVTNLFMDLVDGSKSAGEALRDFVKGFALAMAQIAARALATYLVLQMLDAVYPGLGKATATTMSAGVHHAGGIAGRAGARRSLPAWMFGAAPRYHTGGIAGLGPDEVPAVLQRGEEVLTRNDPRHRDNGGGQGGRVEYRQPIVAIGDDAVANALAGAAGENVVMTHVRNNWEGLHR